MDISLSTGKALAITGALFLFTSIMILRPESEPQPQRVAKTPAVARKIAKKEVQPVKRVAVAPAPATKRIVAAPQLKLVSKKQALRTVSKKNRSIASVAAKPAPKLSQRTLAQRRLQAQNLKARQSKPAPGKAASSALPKIRKRSV
jgi:hypothetical protein